MNVKDALIDFLDDLYAQGASLIEIARSLHELNAQVHNLLVTQAYQTKDPEILRYLEEEQPHHFARVKFREMLTS